jgi:transposase-like protein
MVRKNEVVTKQQIISEYLLSDQSFEALSLKYSVKARTIQTWVRRFRMEQTPVNTSSTTEGLKDIRLLQKQLEDAQLKNELLEEMLRLSEEQTGIDLRKKFGARQS